MSYIDTETGRYGITEQEIRDAHPLTIFPMPFDPPTRFAWVHQMAPPVHDSDTHRIELGEPAMVGDRWQQPWQVIALTAEEIEALRLQRVPQAITRRQGRKALQRTARALPDGGQATLLQLVEEFIAGIEDPALRADAQIEYEADEWEIHNPFLVHVWTTLGGTQRELQDLFSIAATQ